VSSGGHHHVSPGLDSARNMHHGKPWLVITSA
jgi:hypothetical protein